MLPKNILVIAPFLVLTQLAAFTTALRPPIQLPTSSTSNVSRAPFFARQAHNADYGNSAGPGGNPEPSSSATGPAPTSTATQTPNGRKRSLPEMLWKKRVDQYLNFPVASKSDDKRALPADLPINNVTSKAPALPMSGMRRDGRSTKLDAAHSANGMMANSTMPSMASSDAESKNLYAANSARDTTPNARRDLRSSELDAVNSVNDMLPTAPLLRVRRGMTVGAYLAAPPSPKTPRDLRSTELDLVNSVDDKAINHPVHNIHRDLRSTELDMVNNLNNIGAN